MGILTFYKMKIFNFLLPFALAQNAPPESKTCPDCMAFDQAFLDEMQVNGNILNVWVNLLNGACAESPNASLCSILMDEGFMNLISAVMNMGPDEWCADITMCKAQTPFATYSVDHCDACVNMVQDLSLIAKYDSDHWNQIWAAITKEMCSTMQGVQAKGCKKEMDDAQQGARAFMAKQDAKYACAALTFC